MDNNAEVDEEIEDGEGSPQPAWTSAYIKPNITYLIH
jgi:hypothetical protein